MRESSAGVRWIPACAGMTEREWVSIEIRKRTMASLPDRIGAQHLVERAQTLQGLQCRRHMGLRRMALDVDVEVVLPLA